jgi:uncharacterized membrane protein YecN with MAPEG domain
MAPPLTTQASPCSPDSFKTFAVAEVIVPTMHALPMVAYVAAAFVLFGKFVVIVSLQGATRIRTKRFQYAEDASHWNGAQVAEESDLIVRAQRVLRNDSEGQPYFFVFGAAYVALGATPWAAWFYFPAYALTRVLHARYMLRARQPHRNRAFGAGLVTLVALAGHCVITACSHAWSD